MLPLFKSHFSIGKSILTLDDPKKVTEGGSDSVFKIAKDNGLKQVILVEDSLIGFFEAYKRSKEMGIQLIFGLRLSMRNSALPEDEGSQHKIIIFAKDDIGCKLLNKIYSKAFCANSGNFNLGLTGLTADADVQLLNSSGSVIASSVRAGTASESITSQLSAGTYYIRVYPYTGDTNYNLAVSATTATVTPGYSAISGYGLVNAAKAVAGALNQTPFADVPTFGGANDWGVNLVNAPEAWASGYTGQGIVVAVLDTGVDRNHADLAGNIWTNAGEIANDGLDNDGNGYVDDVYGWNFANGNNNTLDGNRHGTHVAGTIAAANNGFGATGVAYNSRIMPVKVLSDSGSGSYSGVAQGIRYAVDNGADVINMSLGGGSTDSAVQSALQYASSRGVIVVMAAGNAGAAQPGYPASNATSWGLAVGAVNSSNQMASFSNRAGSNSSMRYVTAPGVQVYSTLPNGGYGFLSGTSMAAPHVAGVVALMLSANPNLTDAQVRQIITDTAGNVA